MKLANILCWVVIAIPVSISSNPANDPGTWNDLLQRANEQVAAGNLDSALALGQTALSLFDKTGKAGDTALASIHSGLGNFYYMSGDFLSAREEYLKSFSIYDELGLSNDPAAAWTLNTLGATYSQLGSFIEAESVLVAAEQVYDEADSSYAAFRALTLNNLANVYIQLGQFNRAESLLTVVVDIRQEVLEPDDPEIAATYNLLGQVQYFRSDFDSSMANFKRAHDVVASNPDVSPSDEAWPLINLGNVHLELGEFQAAESSFTSAMKIFEKRAATDHVDYIKVLYDLALLQIEIGKYAIAENNLLMGDSILQQQFGPDFQYRADFCNALGRIYDDVNSTAEARSYYEEAIRVRKKTLGTDHPDLTYDLNNLGNLEMETGNFDRAESLFTQCLRIFEQSAETNDKTLLLPLENLARVGIRQKDYTKAHTYAVRAYEIQKQLFGDEHPGTARLSCLLAEIASLEGKFDLADSLFTSGLTTLDRIYKSPQPEAAKCNGWYREHLLRSGHTERAYDQAVKTFKMSHTLFNSNAAFLSETDAIKYAIDCKYNAGRCISIYELLQNHSPGQTQTLASIILSSKGLVTDMTLLKKQAFAKLPETSSAALLNDYQRSKYALSQLYLSSPDEKDDIAAYRESVDSLAAQIRNLEAQMGRSVVSEVANEDTALVSAESVLATMGINGVAIEYYLFSDSTATSDNFEKYCAVVLAPNRPIAIVNLGNAASIDSTVASYHQHIERVASGGTYPSPAEFDNYAKISNRLYEFLIEPLQLSEPAPAVLTISPDAELNLISFGGLSTPEQTFLLERSAIVYRSALRYAVNAQSKSSGSGLLVLGNPDFDATPESRLMALKNQNDTLIGPQPIYDGTRLRGGCLSPGNINVPPLPGTDKEIRSVGEAFGAKSEESATMLVRSAANEDIFKLLAPGKRILHLATHGFFGGSNCDDETPTSRGSLENPLLRSGLLLAGCNQSGRTIDTLGLDDGILSALEISALNLGGTELVVLSSCESGSGEVVTGEGIWGLRRAFQIAGAGNVISALWPVDDNLSATVMGSIYDGPTGELTSRVRAAQLQELNKLRTAGLSPHPFLWAGFVVQRNY